MKKTVIYLYLLLFCALMPLYSTTGDVTCTIRYYNKKIYYTGDNIIIRVEIYNNSPQNYTFQTTDPKHFNTRLTARDLSGRELKDKYKFIREINSVQHVYFRNITLQPGEVFAFNIFLNDIVDFNEAGLYFLQLEFFPEMTSMRNSIKSNIIDLSLRPWTGVPDVQQMIDYETGEILKKTARPPDEVVEYTIKALQKQEFEKYFLYLELENLMQKSQDRKERYIRLSEIERNKMLEEYKIMLMKNMSVDYRTAGAEDIIYVPVSYQIEKTWYTGTYAEVLVTQRFRYADLTEVKSYTYRLRKSDGIWLIYDYTVVNKGIE